MSLTIITHLVLALVAAGGVWVFQDARMDAEVGEVRLEQSNERLEAVSKARTEERSINKTYQEALNAATLRETKLRTDAATARRTADGLRGTLYEFRASLPSASTSALIARADTAAELLGACVSEYRGVAEAADRHAGDALMLQEAWPQTSAHSAP